MLSLNDTKGLREYLKEKIRQIAREPAFARDGGGEPFLRDEDGTPAIRLAVANCSIDTDIWQGLRSPAAVGSYPIGLREVWDYFAAKTLRGVRHDGSPNYLGIPESFDEARSRFDRAVIVSALLPLAPRILVTYAAGIERHEVAECDTYARASEDVGAMVSKVVGKLALALVCKERAVVCMDPANATRVAEFTLPQARTGRYHGPCNCPWPQNSVAVLTGLMQFGVSRIPLRDEKRPDGTTQRLMGSYCSLVVFDKQPLVTDGTDGIVVIDEKRIADMRQLADFTRTDAGLLARRFCAYNRTASADGHSVCGRCMAVCPAGAIANSSPRPNGIYPERILAQKHRFHDGFLDFDFASCTSSRNQMSGLYSEFACAHCVVMCAVHGVSGLSAGAIEKRIWEQDACCSGG